LQQAQQLVDENRPFAAHEVLEEVWHSVDGPAREFWRGVVQVTVGLTHVQRGNIRGAIALLSRGADRVDAERRHAPPEVPVEELVRTTRALVARLAGGERIDPPVSIPLFRRPFG
jgi:predicted metal-dependent hydrolase